VIAGSSDFGGGSDRFVNTGVVRLAAGLPAASVGLAGLESFTNSGTLDLRNGVAGDTLTLPGGYAGQAGAVLGLDYGANGVADKLVVGGVATGSTRIVLNAVAASATLLDKPVVLVKAGAGTAADAFVLDRQNVGLVAYSLRYDAAAGGFALSSAAGGSVWRLGRSSEAAQAIWRQSADAWSSHMAELRDGGGDGTGTSGKRLWGQAFGAANVRHGDAGGYSVNYQQDYYGGQIGFDLLGGQADDGRGVALGVTAGYVSSHVNFRAGPERVRFDTASVGAYAGLRRGPVFANLLAQYDHYDGRATDLASQWSGKQDGDGFGLQGEVGARLGSGALFVEPVASLAWQRTDLGDLHALGQTLDYDNATALTGRLGGRAGGSVDLGGGATALLYARAAYVHEFKGKAGLTFDSGGASERLAGQRIGDHAQTAIGANILTLGPIAGFVEANADIGSNYKGAGGRIGISVKL
jgi:outer membrane autotransporter protein